MNNKNSEWIETLWSEDETNYLDDCDELEEA